MVNSVLCSGCGECLDDIPDLPSGERTPCPKCGSTDRVPQALNVMVSETLTLQEYIATMGEGRNGKKTGFRETAREGRITSVDRSDDGLLSYSILGSSPQGEEDTLPTCRVLISVLNASGGHWTDPVRVPDDDVVDCEAVDVNHRDRKLSIQVVRAIVDEKLWNQLNEQGRFEELNVSKKQLIVQIKSTIEKKNRAIPRADHPSLTLALDATRLPVLGFEDVIEEFQSQFGSWTRSLAFEAIWLVGPQSSLTWRLDI